MDTLVEGTWSFGLELSEAQVSQFDRYYQELIEWNKKFNLTAITDYDEVVKKHFLDSLSVACAGGLERTRIIDVGAGAGFPGLPLRLVFPEMRLTLLEATAKKSGFLSWLVTDLGLNDVEVITGRAEEVAHDSRYREAFDVVLSRGVARLPALAELTLPFCCVGGRVILQKKREISAELESAGRAIEVLGGKASEVKSVAVPGLTDERFLVIVNKVSPTPDAYPRRPGMPVKRPIV